MTGHDDQPANYTPHEPDYRFRLMVAAGSLKRELASQLTQRSERSVTVVNNLIFNPEMSELALIGLLTPSAFEALQDRLIMRWNGFPVVYKIVNPCRLIGCEDGAVILKGSKGPIRYGLVGENDLVPLVGKEMLTSNDFLFYENHILGAVTNEGKMQVLKFWPRKAKGFIHYRRYDYIFR